MKKFLVVMSYLTLVSSLWAADFSLNPARDFGAIRRINPTDYDGKNVVREDGTGLSSDTAEAFRNALEVFSKSYTQDNFTASSVVAIHVTDNSDVHGCTAIASASAVADALSAANASDALNLRLDGSRAMTGNLRLGGKWLSNDGDNEGINIGSDGKVGVGTSTLDYRLNLFDSTGNGLRIRSGDASGDIIFSAGSAGTADKIVMNAAGNMGIGTSSPGGHFEVFAGSSGMTRGEFLVDDANKTVYVGRLSSTPGDHSKFVIRDRIGAEQFVADMATPKTYFNNGPVGIGTTGPRCLLEVYGANAKVLSSWLHTAVTDATTAGQGVGGSIAFVGYKTAQTAIAFFAGIDGYKENGTSGNAAGAMRFMTQPAAGTGLVERARISSVGNLLIGTTTDDGTNKLQVNGPVYVASYVSALGYIDRTEAPDTLAEAYAIVQSHGVTVDGELDHSKLHPAAWGKRVELRPTGNTITRTIEEPIQGAKQLKDGSLPVKEKIIEEPEMEQVVVPDPSGRDLSMVISAQALVIKDLTRRIEALETTR